MLRSSHLEHLGAALRKLRIQARFTQADVCERTGLKTPQLSRWENGHEIPTLESLVKYLSTIGSSLSALEQRLLQASRENDDTPAAALEWIGDRHARRIASDADIRSAVEEIVRRNADGFSRWRHLVEGKTEGTPEEAPTQHHAPELVESLIKSARVEVERVVARAHRFAEHAYQVAIELPTRWPRDQRFRVRARSLELCGTTRRLLGKRAESEAALLCAFELLTQTERPRPRELAVLLGRCAAVAADFDRRDDLRRYAAETARYARAVDRKWPLLAFRAVWMTVIFEVRSKDARVRLAEALFEAHREAWDGFAGQPWGMRLEIDDHPYGKGQILLHQDGPALPSLLRDERPWIHSLRRSPEI